MFGIDSVLGLVFFRLPDVISPLKSEFSPVSRSFLRVPVADTIMPTRGDHNLEDLAIAGQSNSVSSALSALTLGQNPALNGVFLVKSRFFYQDQG